MAGPLLELAMTAPTPDDDFTMEPMVAAKEAAERLNLPLCWLVNRRRRERLRVPHHFIGRLLRFRIGELAAWQRRLAEANDA
jgi:hypothetical protein